MSSCKTSPGCFGENSTFNRRQLQGGLPLTYQVGRFAFGGREKEKARPKTSLTFAQVAMLALLPVERINRRIATLQYDPSEPNCAPCAK
jgi:hypothetical protein